MYLYKDEKNKLMKIAPLQSHCPQVFEPELSIQHCHTSLLKSERVKAWVSLSPMELYFLIVPLSCISNPAFNFGPLTATNTEGLAHGFCSPPPAKPTISAVTPGTARARGPTAPQCTQRVRRRGVPLSQAQPGEGRAGLQSKRQGKVCFPLRLSKAHWRLPQ